MSPLLTLDTSKLDPADPLVLPWQTPTMIINLKTPTCFLHNHSTPLHLQNPPFFLPPFCPRVHVMKPDEACEGLQSTLHAHLVMSQGVGEAGLVNCQVPPKLIPAPRHIPQTLTQVKLDVQILILKRKRNIKQCYFYVQHKPISSGFGLLLDPYYV